MAACRAIGRPRRFTSDERQSRKRLAHERWKAENWEYYDMQRKLLMSRPEYLQYRRMLRKHGDLVNQIAMGFMRTPESSEASEQDSSQ